MTKTFWIDAYKRWPDKIGLYIVDVGGPVGEPANYMGGGLWQRDGQICKVLAWQPFPDCQVREVEHAVHD